MATQPGPPAEPVDPLSPPPEPPPEPMPEQLPVS